MMFSLNSPPESICLLRLSAIGDVTHVLPIVHTLKKTWPDTKLTWVIGKTEHKLVGHLPDVEFVVFDKSQGKEAYRNLKTKLNGRQFDVLLHMQVAMRANWASRQIKAKLKIGFDRARSKDFHGFFIDKRIAPNEEQHVIDGFFSFLEVLGIEEKEYNWSLPIPEEAEAFAEKHIQTDKPVMVISPCSSHEVKKLGTRSLWLGGQLQRQEVGVPHSALRWPHRD